MPAHLTDTGSRVHTAPPEELSATLHTVAIAVERLRLRGIPVQQVLAHSGVSVDDLREPSRLITRAQEIAVFANALRLSSDCSIGLEIGAAMHLPSYGLLGYAMLISRTLDAALRCALAHPVLLGSYFRIGLEVRGGRALITAGGYHYRSDLEALNAEMCLSSLWAIVCDVLGRREPPVSVSFIHAEPDHAPLCRSVFGCPVTFGATRNVLNFPGEWLDRTLPLAEPVSCHMAVLQCEQLEREWARASGDSVMARVMRLLNADPSRYRTLDAVADALCVSGRTLRRRLQAADTSFQALLDQALHERAIEYLQRTTMPISEVADRLGYSEPSSFRQAFRRWTGATPSTLRRPAARR
jgi:AraC-like DNA-binding protein